MATVVIAAGDTSSVSQFYAAMYWGFVISTSFVGISLVQGYLFFTRSSKDRFSIKALVISLLILDPATSLLMAYTIYYYFLINFGVVDALRNVPISWTVEIGFTVLVTAIVQVFFASRVYLVNNVVDALPFGRTAPALVLLFALIAFAVGIVRVTYIGTWEVLSFSRFLFQTLVIIEESFALASDLLASACLCYILSPPRIDSMKRSETLRTLFMFTINRAILMSIVQIGMLVAYLSARDYLYWMPFQLCKSKLYTNTLLAMLNSRSGGSFQSQTTSRRQLSPPIVELAIEVSEDGMENSIEGDMEKAGPSEQNVGRSLSDLASPNLLRLGSFAAATLDD